MEDIFLDIETREKMFAATWLLMAITRAIDTLYIQINDKDSEIGILAEEYIKLGNKNVRVARNTGNS